MRLLYFFAALLLPTATAFAQNNTGSVQWSQMRATTIAAGTGCLSAGTTLNALYTVVSSGASGSCITLSPKTNFPMTVANRTGASIKVYPPSGGQIEALGTNRFITLTNGTSAQFLCTSSTQCTQINMISSGTGGLIFGNFTMLHEPYSTSTPPNAPSAANYALDIQAAQAVGLDGFELDIQAWTNVSYFDYAASVANMFRAVHNLGTGFKLYFMMDCQAYGNPVCSNAAQSLMAIYSNDPNYLHYQGRPALSLFNVAYDSTSGSADDVFWHTVFLGAQTGAGVRPVFFTTPPAQFVRTDGDVAAQLAMDTAWYVNNVAADTEGIAMWGFDNPLSNNTQQKALSQLMANKGKTLMGAVVPWFAQARLLFLPDSGAVYTHDQFGAEGMIHSWMDMITSLRPPFVRVQTWNDHTESDMDPASTAQMLAANNVFWQMPNAALWTHAAYAVVNSYFAQWYKTGVQPANWPDSLYVFYRSGRKTLAPSSPPSGTSVNWNPNGVEATLDDIYVTTILQSPATVAINSGDNVTTINAGAGVNSYRVPFTTSPTQIFTLTRGSILCSIMGDAIVASETQWYNVNPKAFYCHYP